MGQDSGAVAIVAEKINNTQISFLYKNNIEFKEGETVTFQESSAQAVVSTLDAISFDISPNYNFFDGGEVTFYDYGTIKKKPDADTPKKKIKIYYQSGSFDSNDNGDIITVNSYDQFTYGFDIIRIDRNSATDIIDIRPRVSSIASVA